jgi:hypothetical protein
VHRIYLDEDGNKAPVRRSTPNAELVIRVIAVEKLEIERKENVEQLAWYCVPSADTDPIKIDGRDPGHYKPVAA